MRLPQREKTVHCEGECLSCTEVILFTYGKDTIWISVNLQRPAQPHLAVLQSPNSQARRLKPITQGVRIVYKKPKVLHAVPALVVQEEAVEVHLWCPQPEPRPRCGLFWAEAPPPAAEVDCKILIFVFVSCGSEIPVAPLMQQQSMQFI
ncbi:hypothetical protein ATANTOWER_016771 [Ataeniobius toweri]|uniref:Uncharacterized protein n=1 Tax=Ataeniobius toweri TaxID=208326 RepID=A0ABU7AUU6_9TELE|nr:hypothetical protein [Ataeniobius toweri]